jgi:sterol 14-demethylase
MTVRMATCRELAEDKGAVDELAQHYWNIEKSATPFATIFPWFPGPARKAKEKSTLGLYNLLASHVKLRRNASTPSMDPIDILISQDLSNDNILGVSSSSRTGNIPDFFGQTIIGIIFAGVINTGVNCELIPESLSRY